MLLVSGLFCHSMSRRLLCCCCVWFVTVSTAGIWYPVIHNSCLQLQCLSHVTFSNLKCNFANISLGEYQECAIKAVNRTHKYISIYAKLYYRPIVNLMVSEKSLRFREQLEYLEYISKFFTDQTSVAAQWSRLQTILHRSNLWCMQISAKSTSSFGHHVL